MPSAADPLDPRGLRRPPPIPPTRAVPTEWVTMRGMADLPQLDAIERRVLASLLEKQRTVPATYPLTLSALRSACNQSSSREPVSDYDDAALEACARELKSRDLLRIVWAGKGSRTLKYHQLLDEVLDLDDAERALITVLLLRGVQTPGELRTRTERLHRFEDREEVEACLQRLADRPDPLVTEVEARRGRHDSRWADLLSAPPPAEAPPVDLDVVVADGAQARDAAVIAAYDTVAADYADQLGDDLAAKPFDTWLIRRVGELADGAPVADVGTGPGQVAAVLAESGCDVTGFDISPAMVEQARAAHPDVSFEVGDLTRLLRPPAASGWGAITAWYALVHLAPVELPDAVAALARTLQPGGWLALAVHLGSDVVRHEQWLGHAVDLTFVLHDADVVRAAVEQAGLTIVEWYERGPLADIEVDTRRLYVLARRPA